MSIKEANRMNFRIATLVAATMAAVSSGLAAQAADVVSGWASVTPPPAPKVESVTVNVPTTALLLLDFNTPPCDPATRPRCVATIPAVKALVAKARSKGMLVVYSIGGSTSAGSINPELKPLPNDPLVSAGPDKFLGTGLDKVLKDHGIKTVITTGTFANGAVLYTASEAAFRGYKVLVPVDGVPGLTPYAEQITLWQLMNGPRLGGDVVKLTKTDSIGF
jgi:nicotinamidase-related amidase